MSLERFYLFSELFFKTLEQQFKRSKRKFTRSEYECIQQGE